jgi:phytoene synthase
MAAPSDPVQDAARAGDEDRYLASLYAPAEKRRALWALYAFDAEIAAVRSRIREPLPGEARLQWWRDAITTGAQGPAVTGHPVADALNEAIAALGLPEAALQNYLEARVFDLYDDPMPSRTDLEGYCGETAGTILQLSALVLDPAAAPGVASLAGHAACAQAITAILQALPVTRRRGQCYVPRDVLASVGSSPEAFVMGEGDEGAARAVSAMLALAREHLGSFEAGAASLPLSLRPAFLPLALTRLALDRMGSSAQIVRGGQRPSALRKQWTLFRIAGRGWPRTSGTTA